MTTKKSRLLAHQQEKSINASPWHSFAMQGEAVGGSLSWVRSKGL